MEIHESILTFLFSQVQFICKDVSHVSREMKHVDLKTLNSVAFGKKLYKWSLRQRKDKLKDKVRV